MDTSSLGIPDTLIKKKRVRKKTFLRVLLLYMKKANAKKRPIIGTIAFAFIVKSFSATW